MSENKKVEQSSSFPCPGCGGKMIFDPASQKMKCIYCGAEAELEKEYTQPEEYDINTAEEKGGDWGTEVRVIKCQSCGAETVLQANETATACAFCGSPHVLADQSSAGVLPESLIPFMVEKGKAVEYFRKWMKKRWFAPSNLKKKASLGDINGVYLPNYTYDSDASARYTGQEGHHYYVTVPVTVRDEKGRTHTEMRREQRTNWRPTAGLVGKYFDDVPVPGSKRLEEDLLKSCYPYDTTKLVKYKKEFLSGFMAEKPSLSVKEGWSSAKNVIEDELTEMAREDILSRADEARVDHIDARHEKVRYKLTLWPAWLSAFSFKQKVYNVLINGQTGKVGGKCPVSPIKVVLLVAAIVAVLVVLYMLFAGGSGSSVHYY